MLLVPTLLGALALIYFIMNILPGDVALMILGGGEEGFNPEFVANLRRELGLDKPAYTRFIVWLWDALRLDFGNSIYTGVSVMKEMWLRLPISFTLMVMAIIVSGTISIPLGIFMGLRRNSIWDYVLRISLIGGISIPSFWVAILVVITLLAVFNWFPPITYATIFTDPLTSFKQLIFPALVLGYRPVATQARLLRSQILEVLGEDYIRTARAKGLPDRTVTWVHVLKNALPPMITMIGMEAAMLVSGAVIIEVVFGVPGVGSLLVRSVDRRDIPMVQGTMLMIIVLVMVTNLMVDVFYGFLDPRIRYKRRV